MKKLIIFDLYKTLITDEAVKERREYRINALWSLVEAAGLPIRFGQVRDAYDGALTLLAEAKKRRFSLSVFDAVRHFCLTLHINDGTTLKRAFDIWAFANLQIPPKLIPGVAEGLGRLRQDGRRMALISNTGSSPGLSLRFLLAELKIYDYFDDLVFSDEFGFMKPRTMIFQRVLEHSGASAAEALFIGDHEVYDKFGAEQAGIAYLQMNPSLDFAKVIGRALDWQ